METTTARPSLLGMEVAHRMIRADLVRLTHLAERVADGAVPCPDRRAAALAAWVADLCAEIRHHHEIEDDAAWPVIEAAAGAHVDLTELTDDHRALDPLCDALRERADALAATPEEGRRAAARPLAVTLAELRDHLVEHLAAEEASVFPIVERYVPAAEWRRVEERAGRGGPGLAFQAPRMLAVTSAAEQAAMLGGAPAPVRWMLRLVGGVLVARHRRRERVLFG